MNELWKKLSVPSKFKSDSTNNYRMTEKTTVICGSTNHFLQLCCKKIKKIKTPVYNWFCGINRIR